LALFNIQTHSNMQIISTALLLSSLALGAVSFDGFGLEPRKAPLNRRASFPIPSAKGTKSLSSPMTVTGTFDGGLFRFDRGTTCGGQTEGGDKDAVFLVQSGGTIKNVIIGAKQSEGIHCLGPCTIENVWWEDVCEGPS
jgi:hypothetical protein